MKKYINFILFLVLSINVFETNAQNATCDQAAPFCSDTGVDFQNTTGSVTAESGPNYGCLGSEPRPSWFFIKIDQAGDLNLTIEQNTAADFAGTGLDVDFICYGPFTAAEYNAGVCGNLTASNTVACSFSANYIESFVIPNAVVGEYYVILITNYNGSSGYIKMNQTNSSSAGAGSTDCSILDTALGPDQDLCVGDSTVLDATPTAGTPTGYAWSVDTGAGFNVIAGEVSATLTITTSGNYKVDITDTNGNVATDEVLITFHEVPTASATASPQNFCLANGDTIDLSANDAAIINGQDTTVFAIAYYPTQADADAGTSPLPISYTNTSVNETIYAAVYNINHTECRATTSFDIVVNPIPTIILPAAIEVCDAGMDGVENYDLTQLDAGILGSQVPVADFSIAYYTDSSHTTVVVNPTTFVVTNTLQTVYPQVTNTTTNCMSTAIGGIDLSLYALPTANQPNDMTSCVNAANTGQGDFDLTTQGAAILGGQSAADYTVHYYSDAAHTTEITVMPYTASDATIVYTQVVDNLCGTTADTTFTLNVIPNSSVDAINGATFCNGDTTGILVFTSPDAGAVFNWVNDTPSIGLAASGTGDLPSFTATNTSNTAVVATITVTPEVTVNGLTCQGTPENFTITVNSTPTVDAIASPSAYCTGDATTPIAFTGNGVAGTTYNWVNTGDDIGMGAIAGSGDIASFNTVNTGTTVLTATIEVTPSTADCTGATESFTITVNPVPTVDAVALQVLCTGDNTAVINFTGNAVAGVSYEWTNDNTAIGLGASGTGDIASFITTNTTNGQLVANLTVTPVANGCSGTPENFTITVNPTPTVDTIASPSAYCTGDATTPITFTGNGVAGATYNWVNTGDDIGMGAMAGSGDIASFNTVNTGTTVLAATIEVTPLTAASCTGVTESFTITVNPMPTVDVVASQNLCNGDNLTAINFTGNAVAGVTYQWTNDNTAIGLGASGTGDIASYTVVNTTTTPIVAHLTVTPVANGCSGTPENFTITINGTPDSVIPNNQQACDDDNDGFWIFDLTQDETTILNGQDPAVFDVLYYSDAAYTTQIASPATYQNSLAYQPDTIYPQVINTTTGCMSTPNAGFTVEVFAHPYIANTNAALTLCDNDNMINAGSADFDLNAQIPNLLGTQATDPNNTYNVTFYLTQPDADAGINPISSPYNLLTGSQISIFVRIENAGLPTCANTTFSFTIHTYDSPVLTMDPSYTLCLNQGFVTVTSPLFAGYQWLDSSGVVLGTNQSYDFTTGGNYALVVNNADGCTDRADFVIAASENPVITDVVYTEFTENNTIKVFVAGAITNTIVDIDHFEYALDNGPYQDSNVFEGVTPGVHHVVVRDKNGCGETVPYEVVVLGYMSFFTPNGDGDHDIWRVTALQYFPDSKLYIYDRQGKLINTFTETDAGWDGIYNGNQMPSTDYWFLLKLRDGREYRRHFALKR